MRKIIVLSMLSLDGVMQAPGGPDEDLSGGFKYGGWTAAYGDEQFGKIMMEELKPADYLLGRKTYDIFSAYWPQHDDFWPAVNAGAKYVLSNTVSRSDWNNTSFVKTVADIEQLKKSEGRDLHVWGSSELVHLLLKHNLVDQLRVKIYPVLLGKGKKLFDDGIAPASLTLTETQVTSKGVIVANYQRAGNILTGRVEI